MTSEFITKTDMPIETLIINGPDEEIENVDPKTEFVEEDTETQKGIGILLHTTNLLFSK